ncbi:MAG: ABC transporter permease [Anaerolineae bacterium]|nr:ABC transporter permease [Anaerolineae bacterium]MDQ7034995.1 ABC transporter permease [Anaerolineae bacterium]
MTTKSSNMPHLPKTLDTEPERQAPSFVIRLLRDRSGTVGLILVVFFTIISLLGLFEITRYPVLEQHPIDRLQAPSLDYWFGTDQFGRDTFSRIMKGGANSLQVSVISVSVSTLIGTVIGIFAGYVGGIVDTILMRIMDILFAFPSLLLALLVVTIIGAGLSSTVLAITVVYTPIFARVARGPVLSLKNAEFVTAARCLGAKDWRIIAHHIFPNMRTVLIVQVTLALSWALITEAGLSFLGLGTQPPDASWGLMLSANRGLAEIAPWLILFPALSIMLMVLGFNLLGDGLRDVLDPYLKSE